MTRYKKDLGERGELIAAWWLKKKGYEIIDRQFRGRHGEIDLIGYDKDGALCFIEVKMRRNLQFGMPYEAVTRKKLATIKGLARLYMYKKLGQEVSAKIQVVSILEKGEKVKIRLFREVT